MTAPTTLHTFTTTTRLGEVTLEPVVPARDAELVQGWLAHPGASYWQMGELRVDEVREYLAGVQAGPHEDAWLGRLDGEPVFMTETYDPAHVVLVGVHDARPGDLGMHLLVSPPADPAARPDRRRHDGGHAVLPVRRLGQRRRQMASAGPGRRPASSSSPTSATGRSPPRTPLQGSACCARWTSAAARTPSAPP